MAGTAKGAAAYDDAFYQRYVAGMASSAARVLSVVRGFCRMESVLDVGCGRGAWLAAAGDLGAAVRYGYDGPWIRREDLLDQGVTFFPVDFEQPLPSPGRRFDLAMSIEVAEHVSSGRADAFVESLCAASDVVLFGAAVRHQGGEHHVNEQPQSYWIAKFASRGYECFDVIRPAVWDDESVKWWYRQNTFLFARTGTPCVDVQALRAAVRPVTDVVHPALFESRALKAQRLETPSLGDTLKVVRRFLRGLVVRSPDRGDRGS